MRKIRWKEEGRTFHHIVTRVIDGHEIFTNRSDLRYALEQMRILERFTGIRVLNFCIMPDHLHLLVEVPAEEVLDQPSDEILLQLLPEMQAEVSAAAFQSKVEKAREADGELGVQEIFEKVRNRRRDVSSFVKELKQRISKRMNKRLGREGTLWDSRYKAVLVEGSELALMTLSAYIDLNPVRAGLVERPEDYVWSGYGMAMSRGFQNQEAQDGLCRISAERLDDPCAMITWRKFLARYRKMLECEEPEAGQLPAINQILRYTVRYFSDASVIGSEAYIESVFQREAESGAKRFRPKRKAEARPMSGADWGDLRAAKNLIKDPILPPSRLRKSSKK